MAEELIAQKLEAIRHCLRRIEAKCPKSAADLARDADAQDIVALNLTRAVQLCVDIGAHIIADTELAPPHTMGQTFEVLAELGHIRPELAVRMKKAVGFRNLAVHSYEAIDWEIVHALATRHLSDFTDFAQSIADRTEP
jgi:uncharacterized protein YutE (UPF0331/DUF86 family)